MKKWTKDKSRSFEKENANAFFGNVPKSHSPRSAWLGLVSVRAAGSAKVRRSWGAEGMEQNGGSQRKES